MCMLFIKTSKCFTVHCSFTLPAGAGAVIPVSEGSDGGQCWPVGVAAHRKSTRASPDYITAFILTTGISWWGIPRVMGIKIPGLAPTRHLPCGAQQICCTCCCSKPLDTEKSTRNQRLDVDECVFAPRLSGTCLCNHPLQQHFSLSTP